MLTTNSGGDNELRQTNESTRGLSVTLSRAFHTHHGKKLPQDLRILENNTMGRAMVMLRRAREKDAGESVEWL